VGYYDVVLCGLVDGTRGREKLAGSTSSATSIIVGVVKLDPGFLHVR